MITEKCRGCIYVKGWSDKRSCTNTNWMPSGYYDSETDIKICPSFINYKYLQKRIKEK